MHHLLLFVLSWALFACGQPVCLGSFSTLSGLAAFALCWMSITAKFSDKKRYLVAGLWFFAAQIVQLSWMSVIRYTSSLFLLVYLGLALALSLQFVFLTFLVLRTNKWSVLRVLACSGTWVFLEWSRLFVSAGFTWNPVGLAFTGNVWGMQLASITGIYGLSFLFVFLNLCFFASWVNRSWKWSIGACVCFACVFVFGFLRLQLQETLKDSRLLQAVLVQTRVPPEEMIDFDSGEELLQYIYANWNDFFQLFKDVNAADVDLIVFPEGTAAVGVDRPIFTLEAVHSLIENSFGRESLALLPDPKLSGGKVLRLYGREVMTVGNGYMAQSLANILDTDLVIGLDEEFNDPSDGRRRHRNSALVFGANGERLGSYAKRILFPIAEYIPFEWAKPLAAHFGIHDSFVRGEEAKVFQGKVGRFGTAICYEETFGNLMREYSALNADCMVSISNDAWYPDSTLPRQHYDHARLRSVENGLPLLRSSNMGVTIAVDSMGRELESKSFWSDDSLGLLVVDVPLVNYKTIYSQYGDFLVLLLSLAFIVCELLLWRKQVSNEKTSIV